MATRRRARRRASDLIQHLGRDDVARLYQFAMGRDLSRYEPDFRRFAPAYLTQAA